MPHSSVPAPPKRLVVATANSGKLREFRSLLAGLPFELTSLAELGLPSPAETGGSFLANATLKARHAAALSGSAAIADDSGIEVDVLGGAPGIHSARYAGLDADDNANNAKLMSALNGVPLDARRARYQCALVFVEAAGAAPLEAEAAWYGFILDSPRGAGGFGYDPYFWLPELDRTAAELTPDDKNRLSHRGRAMLALRELLLKRFGAQPPPEAQQPPGVRA
jgi:XTP/dITP diphosphohydrolase